MTAEWILVFSFLVPNNPNFYKPILMDTFTTREQCEATLFYLKKSYEEMDIQGSGYCFGVGAEK
jgi:hypothetical protein